MRRTIEARISSNSSTEPLRSASLATTRISIICLSPNLSLPSQISSRIPLEMRLSIARGSEGRVRFRHANGPSHSCVAIERLEASRPLRSRLQVAAMGPADDSDSSPLGRGASDQRTRMRGANQSSRHLQVLVGQMAKAAQSRKPARGADPIQNRDPMETRLGSLIAARANGSKRLPSVPWKDREQRLYVATPEKWLLVVDHGHSADTNTLPGRPQAYRQIKQQNFALCQPKKIIPRPL